MSDWLMFALQAGLLVVTGVAAWAAWSQAASAKRSRENADAAALRADEFQQRAVSAAERQAEALERQLDRPAWGIASASESAWHVINESGRDLQGVTVEAEQKNAIQIVSKKLPATVRFGETIVVIWSKSFSSPSTMPITVRWESETGGPREQHATLA
ncbi:hypothetical protein EV140_1946 [Microcella alkaliphila]|uniref:Uncharacterized protein n=1 Tax=Microcella alkaliphila TaxID=279828 RepID=A0A4Q7TFU8_9MICO|nr:hypothetical protein [Microcella alkaliphila]RZT59341.1 hypothetical protein EV140_1946 [Microcella alkaliphila]